MKHSCHNPYLPSWEYVPDAEPHVFGDRVYVYGSHDKAHGWAFCLNDYVCWSAPVDDLGAWRYEGVIYRKTQDPLNADAQMMLYAPDVAQGPDGRYYLYYVLDKADVVSVAVADTPAGPYEFLGALKNPDGTLYTRKITFDPGLINDDGVIRLYYGWAIGSGHRTPLPKRDSPLGDLVYQLTVPVQAKMFGKTRQEILAEPDGIQGAFTVELDDDMLTVKTEPVRIVPGQYAAVGPQWQDHAFFEASSIRKIGETYYFIYSSHLNHELCYATSAHPDRDFVYRGTIISNGDIGFEGRAAKDRVASTGNNHGSIELIDGQWYVFYHRQTHKSLFSRQACAEPITIAEDGSIEQVRMTSSGLNGGPLPAKGTYSAGICCVLSDGSMPHQGMLPCRTPLPHITHDDDGQHVTEIRDGTRIGFRDFRFTGKTTLTLRLRGAATGWLDVIVADQRVATVPVDPAVEWTDQTVTFTHEGDDALYLRYTGKGLLDLGSLTFPATRGRPSKTAS